MTRNSKPRLGKEQSRQMLAGVEAHQPTVHQRSGDRRDLRLTDLLSALNVNRASRSASTRSVPNHWRPGEPVGDLLPGELRRRIAPGMMLKPFFEFTSHPDQATTSGPSGNNTHAIFIGALFEVDVTHLLEPPTLSR
jgi:hypothetical protein